MKDSTTLFGRKGKCVPASIVFPRAVEMALVERGCAQRPESTGRFRCGKVGQFAGGDEERQRVGDRFDGILSAQLQGAVDRHEERLGPRPLIACVVEGVLAGNHSRANFPFSSVIVEGHPRVIEKGEK